MCSPCGVPHAMIKADVREQRANGIWGDAFRHPLAYQRLCGFADGLTGPVEGPPSLATNQPPAVDAPLELHVAMLQMAPASNKTAALATLELFLRRAAAEGADVALTPEMWNVGWDRAFPADFSEGGTQHETGRPASVGDGGGGRTDALRRALEWIRLGETLDGPYITRLRLLARELDMAVAAGMMRLSDGANPASSVATPPTNSVVVIDRHGDVILVYDKVHTCVWITPSSLLQPGRDFFVAELNVRGGRNVTVGATICADREFPVRSCTVLGVFLGFVLVPTFHP